MKKIIIIFLVLTISIITINKIHSTSGIFFYANKYLKTNVPDNIYVFFRLIFNNDVNTKRTLNDYNTLFLPKTQTVSLNFKKIKIKGIELEEKGYLVGTINKRYSFYFSEHENKILIAAPNKKILYLDKSSLDKEDIAYKEISHNLQKLNFSFKDIITHNNKIYVSVRNNINKKCNILEVYTAKINNLNSFDFKNIFTNSECVSKLQGGKMQIWSNDLNKEMLLLTTSGDDLKSKDEIDLKPQDDKSIYGKILLINPETGIHEVFSKGHRNSLGLYADFKNNIILGTENGPRGGDEINYITKNSNYGWGISSYGTKYFDRNKKEDYKLSHEDFGFSEPLFAFLPSIGISEIIKIEENFTKRWKNNFMIASLNSKHLYRVKFDNQFNKLLFFEKIYIGERIRDLMYLKDRKQILLAMEESGSIGILEIK